MKSLKASADLRLQRFEMESLKASADLRLQRFDLSEAWTIVWPKKIQDAAFATLTHDELMWFGVREELRERVGVIPVRVTIESIEE